MAKEITSGTFYISKAFHQFLHEEIKKNNFEEELNLSPIWTRRMEVEPFDVRGLPTGLMYKEVEGVDYDATSAGMKFYADCTRNFYEN